MAAVVVINHADLLWYLPDPATREGCHPSRPAGPLCGSGEGGEGSGPSIFLN